VIRLRTATPSDLAIWDHGIATSVNGTLFQYRAFLAYHGKRFANSERYIVFEDSSHAVIARMAMVVAVAHDGQVAALSPYGGSFGGLAFARQSRPSTVSEAVTRLLDYLRAEGVQRCVITPPPLFCSRQVTDVLAWALLEQGFTSKTRDLSITVPLGTPSEVIARMRSSARGHARKAERLNVEIVHRAPPELFWPVVDRSFADRGRSTTHTPDEWADLCQRLPDRVYADVALCDGQVVAGIGYLVLNERANSSFYLCQDPARYDTSGLSLLVRDALGDSASRGFEWFDFGLGSHEGRARPTNILFKEGFGGVGVIRETFVWECEPQRPLR